MDIQVNAELRDLIPGLTEQEARDLEASIERRGVDSPLLVADLDGKAVLVDGYARHNIATRLGVTFEVTSFEFTATPENVRERLEREARTAKSRARSTGEAKRLKVMEEELSEEEVAEVDAALPEALHEARLRELRLHRLNHALARRNLERFDLIAAAWKRDKVLYSRAAANAKAEGNRIGGKTRHGTLSSGEERVKKGEGDIRHLVSRATGVSVTLCERALLLIRTAEGDFPAGYESLQASARELVDQIRDKSSDTTITGAWKALKDLKRARDAVDGGAPEPVDESTEDTHIPEDDAIKAFRRMRESVFSHDPLAVAARIRTRTPSEVDRERRAMLQEAAWLESCAEALEGAEVPAGEVDLS